MRNHCHLLVRGVQRKNHFPSMLFMFIVTLPVSFQLPSINPADAHLLKINKQIKQLKDVEETNT